MTVMVVEGKRRKGESGTGKWQELQKGRLKGRSEKAREERSNAAKEEEARKERNDGDGQKVEYNNRKRV